MSGDVLLTQSGASTVARASRAGADLAIIATVMNQVNCKIGARKEIRDVKDLVGKKNAIASRGGSSELGLQLAFPRHTAEPRFEPDPMGAIRQGVVDVTLFSYPELLIATKEGFTVPADLRQFADLSGSS